MFKRLVGITIALTVILAISSVAANAIQNSDRIGDNKPKEIAIVEKVEKETEAEKEEIAENICQENNSTETFEEIEETEPTEQIETVKEVIKFSDDITFTKEYVVRDDVMPYALYTPSTVETNEKIPMIVWLHGSGEVNCSESKFFSSGFLAVLNEWETEGFNAYVLCPQLKGEWNSGRWNCNASKDNLRKLIEQFVSEHNIDVENIVLVGHSLGGQGTLYMARELHGYFARCAVLSGYNSGINNSEIRIPTLGYVGKESYGEDGASVSYMKNYFKTVFGENNFFYINASHGGLPEKAFEYDVNDNNRSDLIEWLLGEIDSTKMQIE